MQQTFVKTEQQQQIFAKISELADQFSKHADEIDKNATFPFENIELLKKNGYTKLTVPHKYGGEGISLYDLVLFQERLAQGDASTALSIGWHLGIVMDLADKQPWKEATFQQLCMEIVEKGTLINSAVSEKATGSPTRGGKPLTTATKQGDHWVLNGTKTFTTMSPALDYFIVVATVDENYVAQFLVPRDTKGLQIEETWDTMAMRGTGSHDLILDNVILSEEALVQKLDENSKRKASGWMLHIPACYLGVAIAARDYAIQYATSYKPNSIRGSISELPNIRQLIGSMELELMNARYFLYSIAEKWDHDVENRHGFHAELGAVKHIATNTAISVVDKAMRITGAQSLYTSSPLQRYYRDVRAGLHNPPMDDAVISMLANRAIE
ncbi:acyl-CoA dehydrogenase family protein [Bacillus sp. Marseille-P3661]|uniref:acyl-CoA dehydrogenase family protein n=1 Tax=Bacillus sp. Marseille-P3661 TaxID=1936234 RepID=UPI000C83BF13|nr:acyl-CoA dehydrogenase family protein [Bacillus sp. Marseille-P3661]